jgi:hypothetical protein
MNITTNPWENKIMTVCGKCGQNIRIPISAKPLIVTCPKCRNEFRYDYRSEFGSQAEYPAGFHIKEILPILIYLALLVVSIVLSIINKNVIGAVLTVAVSIGLLFLLYKSPASDYASYFHYRQVKLVLMNRQGIIFFNQASLAVDCVNWSDVRSVKYLLLKQRLTGKMENEGRPVSVELEVSGKGTVRFPPALFFSAEQRQQMIDQVSTHLGASY